MKMNFVTRLAAVLLAIGAVHTVRAEGELYSSLTNLGPYASSRVLLVNNDTNPICPIKGQGYHDTANTVAVGQTYWWHDDTPCDEVIGANIPVVDVMNLQSGIHHILYQKLDGGVIRKLWELIDCRVGSSAVKMSSANFNYLPWSSTCQPIDGDMYSAPIPDEWVRGSDNSNGVKQVATITMRASLDAEIRSPLYEDGIGDIYFDAVNVLRSYPSLIAVEISTDESNWVRVPCEVFVVSKDGTCVRDTENDGNTELGLYLTEGGSSQYYRIRARINYEDSIRFRIVRTNVYSTDYLDYGDLVSIDNIIATRPVQWNFEMQPSGSDGAVNPFLKTGDGNVRPVISLSSINPNVSSGQGLDSSVTNVNCEWKFDSADGTSGEWNQIGMSLSGDGSEFICNSALPAFTSPGTLSYRYTADMGDGNEGYVDFANDNPVPVPINVQTFESEVRTSVVGECTSFLEGCDITVYKGGELAIANRMSLVGDNTWQGIVMLPGEYAGSTVRFRFCENNRAGDGGRTWGVSKDCNAEFPSSGLAVSGIDAENEKGFLIEKAPLHMVFRFNEKTGVFAIERNDNVEMLDIGEFPMSRSTSPYWWENFDSMAGHRDYPFGVPFGLDQLTPNGWTASHGMFINGMFSAVTNKTTHGMALQLKGNGIGTLSLIDPADVPRGVGTVSFTARLAQRLDFGDFHYYVDGTTKNNYAISAKVAMTNKRKHFSDVSTGSPSLSLVAYYRPNQGCYEMRVTRVSTASATDIWAKNGKMELAIYKWRKAADPDTGEIGWRAVKLASKTYTDTEANYLVPPTSRDLETDNKNWSSMFFAAYTSGTSTYLEGAIAVKPSSTAFAYDDFSLAANKMYTITFTDTDEPFVKGSYGVCTKECPGTFGHIQIHEVLGTGPYKNESTGAFLTGKFKSSPEGSATVDRTIADGDWGSSSANRMVKWIDNPVRDHVTDGSYYYGLCAAPVVQRVHLKTAPYGNSSQWTDTGLCLLLTGYTAMNIVFSPRILDPVNVRFSTGDFDADIVLDNIQLSQWAGDPSQTSDLGSMSKWAFTDAWVAGTTNDVYQGAGSASSDSVAAISGCGYYVKQLNDSEYIYVFTNTTAGALGNYVTFVPKQDIIVKELFVLGAGGGGGPGGGGGGGGNAIWVTNDVEYAAGEEGIRIYVGNGGSGGATRYSNNSVRPSNPGSGGTSYVSLKNPLKPTETQQYRGYGGYRGGNFYRDNNTCAAGAGSSVGAGAGGGSALITAGHNPGSSIMNSALHTYGREIYAAGYGGAAVDGAPGGGGGGGLRGIAPGTGSNYGAGNASNPTSVIYPGQDGADGIGDAVGGKGGDGFPLSALGDSEVRYAIGELLGDSDAWLGGGGGGGSGRNTDANAATWGKGAYTPGVGGNWSGGAGGLYTAGSYSSNYTQAKGRDGVMFAGGGGGGGSFCNPVTNGNKTASNWIIGGGKGGGGLVVMHVKVKDRFVMLQPMRGSETEPVSIRTPLLSGISQLSFAWKHAHSNAVLKVQIATNDVDVSNIRSFTQSLDNGWTDCGIIDFSNVDALLREQGSTNILIDADSGTSGILRLLADPTVVATARKGVTNDLDPMYGAIALTSMAVVMKDEVEDDSTDDGNDQPRILWSTGFEELASGVSPVNGSDGRFSYDGSDGDDESVVALHGEDPSFDASCGLPSPFTSFGANYLHVNTGMDPIWISIAGSKGYHSTEPLLIDSLARFMVTPADDAVQLAALAIRPRSLGFVMRIDDKLALCRKEFRDEATGAYSTNWCVVAGDETNEGTIEEKMYILESADPANPIPDAAVDSMWVRVSILATKNADSGSLEFEIYLNGALAKGDGRTRFLPHPNAADSSGVLALGVSGEGLIDNIAFSVGAEVCNPGEGGGSEGEVYAPASDFEWIATNGYVTITNYVGTNAVVKIPPTIDGMTVACIGDSAFRDRTFLVDVILPDGLTCIEGSAFYGCRNLRDIMIPAGTTYIGWGAFYGCRSFTSVVIPDNVQFVNSYAFYECSALTNLCIGTGVREIGFFTLGHCKSLVELNLPDSITSIADSAFYGCSGLSRVMIPAGVTKIAGGAFEACDNLQEFVVDEGSMSFAVIDGLLCNRAGTELIRCPYGMSDVIVPGSITNIGERAFSSIDSSIKITLPEGLKEIDSCAFIYCRGLTDIIIPQSVTSIGRSAFQFCSSLTNVIFNGNAPAMESNPFDYGIPSNCTAYVKRGSTGWGVDIPGTWNGINIAYLEEDEPGEGGGSGGAVYAPASDFEWIATNGYVTITNYVGTNAVVNIPPSIGGLPVQRIESSAFYSCLAVEEVVIPEGVTYCFRAFQLCPNLRSITIPDSLNSSRVGAIAASGCNKLIEYRIADNSSEYALDNGVVYSKDYSKLVAWPQGLTNVVIRDEVTAIGDYAFSYCGTKQIDIPESVLSVGEQAFIGCNGLHDTETIEGVTLVDGWVVDSRRNVTHLNLTGARNIAASAVRNRTKLESVVLPSTVSIVGFRAFQDCWSLTNVVIQMGVSVVDAYAFKGCRFSNVNIPKSIVQIGEHSFHSSYLTTVIFEGNSPDVYRSAFSSIANCTAYVNRDSTGWGVEIPGKWQGINIAYLGDDEPGEGGGSEGEVYAPISDFGYFVTNGYVTITNYVGTGTVVNIPPSIDGLPVQRIERRTFYRCDALEAVVIPEGVTHCLGVFASCPNLRSITIPDSLNSSHVCRIADSGCKKLIEYRIADNSSKYALDNGVVYCKDYSELVGCPQGLTNVVIRNGVTAIGSHAFSKSNIKEIDIPNSVTNIENNAFSDSKLTNIAIPESILSIGDHAFDNCDSLISVAIEDGVLNIGSHAFADCDSLISVLIPGSITKFGTWVFDNCSSLKDVIISNGVTRIESRMFEDCYSLANVILPNSLTQIGDDAFLSCTALKTITIPSSVTNIEGYAFSRNTSFEKVIFDGNAPMMGTNVFLSVASNCTAYVKQDSTGWGVEIPGKWQGINIAYLEDITPTTYTVNFDLGAYGTRTGGGELTQSVVEGECAVAPMVQATPGWKFAGWMPDVASVILSNTTFVAQYEKDVTTYHLEIVQPARGGSITGASSGPQPVDSMLMLTRKADTGYHIVGWTGNIDGLYQSGDSLTVVMDMPRTIGLAVAPDVYAITYADTRGAANGNPATYTIEDEVVFAPLPNVEGWEFVGWSPASIAKGSTGAKTVTAQWKRVIHTVTVGGDSTNVIYGSEMTFRAPEPFVDMTNGMQIVYMGTSFTAPIVTNEFTVVVTNDIDFTWNILSTNYWFETAQVQNGMIEAPEAGWKPYGESFLISAMPANHYHFVTWTGDTEGCIVTNGNGLVVTMDQARSIGVEFAIDTFTVLFKAGAHGSLSGKTTQTVAYSGKAEVPSVIPHVGYNFVGWSGDVTAPVTGNRTFEARYATIPYEITYAELKGAANLNPLTYTIEDEVVFAPLPNVEGWEFVGWSPASIAKGSTGAKTVAAQWKRVIHTVTVGGDSTNVIYGSEMTFRAPEPIVDMTNGMQIVYMGTSFTSPDVTNEFTVVVTNDVEFSWDVLATNYWLDVSATEGGSVDFDEGWISAGMRKVVSASAEFSYRFVRWEGDVTESQAVSAQTAVVMDRTRSLKAVFERIPITVGEAANAPDYDWYTEGDTEWVGEWSKSAADGIHAARSGTIGNSQETAFGLRLEGAGTLSFDWRASCEEKYDAVRLEIDGSLVRVLSGETSWTNVCIELGLGEHDIRWVYKKGRSGSAGEDAVWVDNVVWTAAAEPTLAEALGDFAWETEGDVQWKVMRSEYAYEGNSFAMAEGLGAYGVSVIRTKVSGAGRLMFQWAVSCEESYDWFDFLVDGEVVEIVTGETNWRKVTVDLGEGEHILEWAYWKDEMDDPELAGANCAMLDHVQWYPAGEEPPELGGKELDEFFEWLKTHSQIAATATKQDAQAVFLAGTAAVGKAVPLYAEFLAGTDPEDPTSEFKATIEFKNGSPVVSPSPDLGGTRRYTVYGKKDIGDADEVWTPVGEGEEANYRFFKVTVDMP